MDNRTLANAVRILSMDGVQKAKSGHPGAPMGMADIAEVLWRRTMQHNPKNPAWANRDRFVLSNGHASMLLYSLLHLTGYDLSLDELKQFRQLNSRTAGHPEYNEIPGIETTTGPLSQGFANAVGMALAEKLLAQEFNRPSLEIVDHYTYVFLGDGCLMEGLSHEAASLAGTWKLGKLIAFYDNNGISIDGEVQHWMTDDTVKRFEAYNWQVINGVDGHDSEAVEKAIKLAQANGEQPTLIMCRTTIGFGSPNKQGKASSHGAPLGEEEVMLTRKNLGWKDQELFHVSEDIYAAWDCSRRGAKLEKEWNLLFAQYKQQFPDEAAEFVRRQGKELPANWQQGIDALIAQWSKENPKIASRKASQLALDALGPALPELIGGSADLTPSNLTNWKGSKNLHDAEEGANYIHFGVREFGMVALLNGMSLHGGYFPYCGTFLIFMEYAKNAIRMAALMGIREIYVFTHDSIGLGEDGPTHQPIEQMAILRMTPNMVTWRPADALETAIAWKSAIQREDGPVALLLSRQNLEPLARSAEQIANIEKGGYVLWENSKTPDVLLIGTGSEMAMTLEAGERLGKEGVNVRVVSLPSPEVFEKQSAEYRNSVLPADVEKRVVVEAGWDDYWYKYAGLKGKIIGLHSFGKSGPYEQLFEYFGITSEAVYEAARSLL